jgi:hypothetical protein
MATIKDDFRIPQRPLAAVFNVTHSADLSGYQGVTILGGALKILDFDLLFKKAHIADMQGQIVLAS